MIDGEWAQRWALQRLWLAEIGRQLFVSAFLTGRHYNLLWFSGVLSHNYSQLVCFRERVPHRYDPSEVGGFLSKSLARRTDVLTHSHADGWTDGCVYAPASVFKVSPGQKKRSQIIRRREQFDANTPRTCTHGGDAH